jgi:hypothetical protein
LCCRAFLCLTTASAAIRVTIRCFFNARWSCSAIPPSWRLVVQTLLLRRDWKVVQKCQTRAVKLWQELSVRGSIEFQRTRARAPSAEAQRAAHTEGSTPPAPKRRDAGLVRTAPHAVRRSVRRRTRDSQAQRAAHTEGSTPRRSDGTPDLCGPRRTPRAAGREPLSFRPDKHRLRVSKVRLGNDVRWPTLQWVYGRGGRHAPARFGRNLKPRVVPREALSRSRSRNR